MSKKRAADSTAEEDEKRLEYERQREEYPELLDLLPLNVTETTRAPIIR